MVLLFINKHLVPPELFKDIWDTHKVMGISQMISKSVPFQETLVHVEELTCRPLIQDVHVILKLIDPIKGA